MTIELTFACLSCSQLGRKKYCNPLSAPSRVSDLPKNIIIKINGKVAVKYRTLADDLIDFHIAKYTRIQAQTRHATSSHLIAPGYSIPSLICNTLFLD